PAEPCHVRDRGQLFFPTRRRHTRSKRNWSSDVCSSDLSSTQQNVASIGSRCSGRSGASVSPQLPMSAVVTPCQTEDVQSRSQKRSEERRVGKEGGGRWGGEDEEE